jgi:hypothetical protein
LPQVQILAGAGTTQYNRLMSWLMFTGVVYSVVEVLAAFGYVTQIHQGLRTPPASRTFSVTSWTVWFLAAVSGTAYVLARQHPDWLITAVFVTHIVGCLAILLMAIESAFAKRQYNKTQLPGLIG